MSFHNLLDLLCALLEDEESNFYAVILLIGIFLVGFYLFSPLTFGTPSTADDLNFLRWLDTWDFKITNEGGRL